MIPSDLFLLACNRVISIRGPFPFKEKRVPISLEHIKATMEILNGEPNKSLPMLHQNASRHNQPDGLDKRLKEQLGCDTRVADIISGILQEAGIVETVQVENPATRRMVKGAQLKDQWTWEE